MTAIESLKAAQAKPREPEDVSPVLSAYRRLALLENESQFVGAQKRILDLMHRSVDGFRRDVETLRSYRRMTHREKYFRLAHRSLEDGERQLADARQDHERQAARLLVDISNNNLQGEHDCAAELSRLVAKHEFVRGSGVPNECR